MFPLTRLLNVIGKHRWLIFELVKRDVALRYRGTWLGFLWSLLNPLIMTAVYTLVFSYFLASGIHNFSPWLFCAMLPWNWFAESISLGSNCLLERPGFVRDAVFPCEVLPVVSISTAMMNFVFSIPVLLIILLAFKVTLGWSLLLYPVIMAVQFLFSYGLVLFLGVYSVFFRDLRYLVNLSLLALFFLTPIFYDIKTIPQQFVFYLKLNPLTHIVFSYRQVSFYNSWPYWDNLAYVLIISVVLIVLGSWIFERHRESFAEYL